MKCFAHILGSQRKHDRTLPQLTQSSTKLCKLNMDFVWLCRRLILLHWIIRLALELLYQCFVLPFECNWISIETVIWLPIEVIVCENLASFVVQSSSSSFRPFNHLKTTNLLNIIIVISLPMKVVIKTLALFVVRANAHISFWIFPPNTVS